MRLRVIALAIFAALGVACDNTPDREYFNNADDACRTTLVKVWVARVSADETTLRCYAGTNAPGSTEEGDLLATFKWDSEANGWYDLQWEEE
jgi:hypothetical protein